MMEKTLVLLKPDSVQRGLIGEIITRFEKVGLKIIGMKMIYADKRIAGDHYADDDQWYKSVGEKALASAKSRGLNDTRTPKEIGIAVREMLMNYISMSPVVALVLEGHGAVKLVRKIVGDTNPQTSLPGTIRGDYTIDSYALADASGRPIQNLIHASGEIDEAKREIALWFKKEEIHAWKRVDEALIYRKGS
jgi:nucleoside-diphosphate kinase